MLINLTNQGQTNHQRISLISWSSLCVDLWKTIPRDPNPMPFSPWVYHQGLSFHSPTRFFEKSWEYAKYSACFVYLRKAWLNFQPKLWGAFFSSFFISRFFDIVIVSASCGDQHSRVFNGYPITFRLFLHFTKSAHQQNCSVVFPAAIDY